MWDLTIFDDFANIVFQDSYDSLQEAIREGNFHLRNKSYGGQIDSAEDDARFVNDNDGRGWNSPFLEV